MLRIIFGSGSPEGNVEPDTRPQAPSRIRLSATDVDEQVPGAVVGTVTVQDIDSTSHTVTVDDIRFEIVNGTLKLKDTEQLTYASASSVTVTMTATDPGGLSRVQSYVLNVIRIPSDVFDPQTIYTTGRQGLYLKIRPEYLFQDAAGTVPVTADGQTVERVEEASGTGMAMVKLDVATSGPIYRTDGTTHWLEFNGSSQGLMSETQAAGDILASKPYHVSVALSMTSPGTKDQYFFGTQPKSGDSQNNRVVHIGHDSDGNATVAHWNNDADYTHTFDSASKTHQVEYTNPGSKYMIDGAALVGTSATVPSTLLSTGRLTVFCRSRSPGSTRAVYVAGKLYGMVMVNDGLSVQETDDVRGYLNGEIAGTNVEPAPEPEPEPAPQIDTTAWDEFSGATITPADTVSFSTFDRQLTPLPSSPDSPVANPPVNLDTAFDVSGDFSVTVDLDLGTGNDAYISLYGEPPMVQDEWRLNNNSVKIEFVNGDWCYWTVYHDDNTNTFGDAAATVKSGMQVTVARQGGNIVISTADEAIATTPDTGIFDSGRVLIGMHEAAASQSFEVTAITTTGTPVTLAPQDYPAKAGSLRDTSTDIPIGTAVSTYPLVFDAQYAEALGQEFNRITVENALKPQFVQPAQGQFDFYEADRIVEFAELNGMSIHGHTFVWNEAQPQWIHDAPTAEVEGIMTTHITTVMQRYAGRIDAWDVINEPFVEFTATIRPSPYFDAMGRDYIKKALTAARAADPNALLFINEWGCESPGTKQDALYDLVVELQAAGAPIDGVGFQMHEDMNDPGYQNFDNTPSVSKAQLKAAMERFQALGIQVRVSELDINVHQVDANTYDRQALFYGEYLEACREVGAHSFTMWGFTDKWSSLQAYYDYNTYGTGLIFDETYAPKPAYQALLDALVYEPPVAVNLIQPSLLDAGWENSTYDPGVDTRGTIRTQEAGGVRVDFYGPSNHHVWFDLVDGPLTTGDVYTLTVSVDKATFTGDFQMAYYEGGTSVNSEDKVLVAGEQTLEFEFTAGAAPTDPSIRLIGWGEGLAGEYLVIKEGVTLVKKSEGSVARPNAAQRGDTLVTSVAPDSAQTFDAFLTSVNAQSTWGEENTSIVSGTTEDYFRTLMPAGSSSGADSRDNGQPLGGSGWEADFMTEDRATLRYDVFFPAGFDFVNGGKLPGLYGGDSPSGGASADSGFTMRIMWRAGGEGEVYAYHPGKVNTYGDSWGRGTFVFTPGQWHTIELEVALNDVGQANGSVALWFDGNFVFEQTGETLRTSTNVHVEGIMSTIFFGGTGPEYRTPVDQTIDTARLQLFKPSSGA